MSWAILLCMLVSGVARANLIANGSFETGTNPGTAMQLASGSTAVTGWTVTRASVDYIGTLWSAARARAASR
jgi:hypothetical protein